MGFNNYTYVGFYFKVKHKTIETTEENTTYVTESGESFDEYTKFSPDTGEITVSRVHKIVKKEIIKDLHDFVDILDKDPDDYFGAGIVCPEYTDKPDGYSFMLPCPNGRTSAVLDEGESFEISYDINLEYDDFIADNLEFKQDLEKVFERVQVCFGAINYAE